MTENLEFPITVVADLATIITVTGKKSWKWKKAAKAALELAQDEIEIISDYDVEVNWEKVTEKDMYKNDTYPDWEVTIRAKINLEVTVLSKNLEDAKKEALELAQKSVDITSTSDVDVEWHCY